VARVGLLGGTFNPPHVGHLVCATCAREELGLDLVRLVPAAVPPHKEVPDDPGVDVRVELCRLACAGDPGLDVSTVDAERPGRAFTVDTLRSLHAASPDDELTFIVGGDMAFSFPQWREPEAILELARLGVAEREEVRRRDILAQLAPLPGATERVDFFDMPRIDISSSLLRRRVATGRSIRHMVPDAVAARIDALGLYRDASRVGEAAWA
jgi:nicotinate-nucleotide adenylyltransferase